MASRFAAAATAVGGALFGLGALAIFRSGERGWLVVTGLVFAIGSAALFLLWQIVRLSFGTGAVLRVLGLRRPPGGRDSAPDERERRRGRLDPSRSLRGAAFAAAIYIFVSCFAPPLRSAMSGLTSAKGTTLPPHASANCRAADSAEKLAKVGPIEPLRLLPTT